MAEILNEFGPDASGPQKPRAKSGGVQQAEDVNNYQMPQGPSSINNPQSPGLHGEVYLTGSQTATIRSRESGSPGIGGSKKPSGSQK